MSEALFHLIVVIALIPLIILLVWLMKRFSPKILQGRLPMQLLGQISLGGRERVMAVEVSGRTLILGVSAHSIQLLANIESPLRDKPSNE